MQLNFVNSCLDIALLIFDPPVALSTTFAPTSAYRDRIYIIKDLILKLVEFSELNQTALMSFCGLNMKKHKLILDALEKNGLIVKRSEVYGRRVVSIYSPTHRGIQFCSEILEPYEKMFPRRSKSSSGSGQVFRESRR
jgi:predicted transcriptional regulator